MDEKHVASQSWQARMFKDLEDQAVAEAESQAFDRHLRRPMRQAMREALEERLVFQAHRRHERLVRGMEVIATSIAWVLADWPLDKDLFWDRLIEATAEAEVHRVHWLLHPVQVVSPDRAADAMLAAKRGK